MILSNVSIPIAFGAGFLSFFSPCILPMIPVYIMYMTGTNMESELNKRKFFVLRRTLGFVMGFTVIFMIMGTSASFLGRIFIRNRDIFYKASGILIILFGLNMMGVLKIRFLNVERRAKISGKAISWFTSDRKSVV